MEIDVLLSKIELPSIFKREGKDCYYDTYRKKLIEITPEETIRQKIAALFEQHFGVPKEMILLEVPMSYYVEGALGRADIVIHIYDEEEQCFYPITVIECKNENIFLTDNVIDQAIRYSDTIGAKYIVVTNGIEIKMAVYKEETSRYVFLDKILSYSQMVNNEYNIPEFKEEKQKRFSYEELQNRELLWNYNISGNWIFGEDTLDSHRALAINFYQALLDTAHKLPTVKRRNFELIEDIGQRFMDYGNAGGGHYNGMYRAFLVNDRFGEPQIVSFSMFGTDAGFRGEKRNSYTSLIVAIDRFKTSHNSLQFNVDRFVKILPAGRAEFLHNGQISSIKSDDVVAIVSKCGEGIHVDSSCIHLGIIDNNKLLYLDDRDVAELIYNFIEYALLREEIRRIKKRK